MKKIYESMTREELKEELDELVKAYPRFTKASRRIAWERIGTIREILDQKS